MDDDSPLAELGIDIPGVDDQTVRSVVRFDLIVGFGPSDTEHNGLPCTDARLTCGNYITVPIPFDDFKKLYEGATGVGISVAF
jgi:hypothetical protein